MYGAMAMRSVQLVRHRLFSKGCAAIVRGWYGLRSVIGDTSIGRQEASETWLRWVFYRWLMRDYRALFPRLPERTQLFCLFMTHQAWTDTFLATPTLLAATSTISSGTPSK